MGNNITQVGNLLQIEFDSSFQPTISKVSSGKYLQWGDNNAHPNYLLELYNRDAVHGWYFWSIGDGEEKRLLLDIRNEYRERFEIEEENSDDPAESE